MVHRSLSRIKPGLRLQLLDGFNGILRESLESSRAFIHFAKLDPGLVSSLIKLKSSSAKCISEAVSLISKKADQDLRSAAIASVISLLKGDLNELPSFVTLLGLSPSKSSLVALACPLGHLSQVEP